jgi:uncharacterized membrane protein
MAQKELEEGKVFAFLGIFLTLIGFIIVLLMKKDNKYAMHYAKQGLVLFIAYVIVAVAGVILAFIPLIGWLIMFALWITLLILWIIGIIYSLSGEMKEIPIIGEFAKKIHI